MLEEEIVFSKAFTGFSIGDCSLEETVFFSDSFVSSTVLAKETTGCVKVDNKTKPVADVVNSFFKRFFFDKFFRFILTPSLST